MKKLFSLILLLLVSCTSVREYNSITVYDPIENSDDCIHSSVDMDGSIVYNTSMKYIKANVFGENKKFKVESFKYGYRPFYLGIFNRKKEAISITATCENGYSFYILFDMYCILTIPDDGDDDICDDKIFYSL